MEKGKTVLRQNLNCGKTNLIQVLVKTVTDAFYRFEPRKVKKIPLVVGNHYAAARNAEKPLVFQTLVSKHLPLRTDMPLLDFRFWPKLVVFLTCSLLISTAFLKTISPAHAVSIALAYGLSYWVIILSIQIEILVAGLLLSGWHRQWAVRCAVGLFIVFALFSLFLALSGSKSCGCFGALKVNPWITFSLDLVFVCLLSSLTTDKSTDSLHASRRVLWTSVAYCLLAVSSLSFMNIHRPSSLDGRSTIDTSSGFVILEPNKWIGRPFPLQEFLNAPLDFSAEETFVLLYHHECPTCQAALKRYDSLARSIENQKATRVVVIEVPPFGKVRYQGEATSTRLASGTEWFVQTPVELKLSHGRVVKVSLR